MAVIDQLLQHKITIDSTIAPFSIPWIIGMFKHIAVRRAQHHICHCQGAGARDGLPA